MIRHSLLACCVWLSATVASAQHPAGIAFQNYGPTCSFFLQDATIAGSYDASTGDLTIEVDPAATCCNTYLSGEYLLIGVAPLTGLPALPPPFAPGCEILVWPFATLFSQGDQPWTFRMPPFPPGMKLYMQGVARYFTTIGFTDDLQTTDGLDLTVL